MHSAPFDQREYYKRWYEKNKAREIARAIENNAKKRLSIKAYLDQLKTEKGCSECGYSKNPKALEFHHLRDKEHSIADMAHAAYSLDAINKEIDKCVILCSNCHRETHG